MSYINDLTAFVVHLQSLADGALPMTNGHLVHAAFLKMAASFSPPFADSLHNRSEERPFTLSDIRAQNHGEKNGHKNHQKKPVIFVAAKDRFRIRITGLKSDVSHYIPDIIEQYRNDYLEIRRIPFRITDWDMTEHPRTGKACYKDLQNECLSTEPLLWFGWSFLSPTAIHSKGRNVVFPEPAALFPRLAARWNCFCPEMCRIPYGNNKAFGDLVRHSLMPAANHIKTHMLDFGPKGRQIGFTGYVEFLAARSADPDILKILHLLGRFSFFSGVGYATTKGMGQVDFILP